MHWESKTEVEKSSKVWKLEKRAKAWNQEKGKLICFCVLTAKKMSGKKCVNQVHDAGIRKIVAGACHLGFICPDGLGNPFPEFLCLDCAKPAF